jgi:small subunit ribosomal protein S17
VDKKPHKKKYTGTVVSSKMDKTIVVAVETKIAHPIYKKYIKSTKKYKAHDESNECKAGDLVEITECRPISKDKKWRFTKLIKESQEN